MKLINFFLTLCIIFSVCFTSYAENHNVNQNLINTTSSSQVTPKAQSGFEQLESMVFTPPSMYNIFEDKEIMSRLKLFIFSLVIIIIVNIIIRIMFYKKLTHAGYSRLSLISYFLTQTAVIILLNIPSGVIDYISSEEVAAYKILYQEMQGIMALSVAILAAAGFILAIIGLIYNRKTKRELYYISIALPISLVFANTFLLYTITIIMLGSLVLKRFKRKTELENVFLLMIFIDLVIFYVNKALSLGTLF